MTETRCSVVKSRVGTDPMRHRGYKVELEHDPFGHYERAERLAVVRARVAVARDSITDIEQGSAAEINAERGGDQLLVAVPSVFWNDHLNRELDHESVEVRSIPEGNDDDYAVVVMSVPMFEELVDDAAHYSTFYDEDDFGHLTESARRVICALWEQQPDRMRGLARRRESYDNLAWALGIEGRDRGVIVAY